MRRDKIELIIADATQLPFAANQFDRVLSTCVLHHISTPELALREMRRVSSDGAMIDIYLPCDPGMLYRSLRHFTSHLKQKRLMKLEWREVKYLWAREHGNHYLGLTSLINEVYKNDKIKFNRFPFVFLSWNFNLFTVVRVFVSKEISSI
jgi:ubiquinone/menaquinone biosynthesis C-methylase UbiE